MESNPLRTQRDVGFVVVTELSAAGFEDAEEIGRGGFGIVYRCTQPSLDRVVAVKVLTGDLDEDRERFLREQRAMGRLTGHPNIVGVLEVGETQSGYPYLVMQYHRQGSLEARIRRLGPLGTEDMLRLGVKMAGSLETAHRLAVLHRDVKPGNILITDYGEPALSDFGIAHVAGGFRTATGTFTGSPAFTAPEILSGDAPSQASDVYGLGSTLFCALTGHAAFERRHGEQVVAQFLRIATEAAPDLRERGIPNDIASVIDGAMSRDPNARPPAFEMGQELQRLQARHGFPVDEMALRGDPADRPDPLTAAQVGVRPPPGNIPLQLTSFVGRRTELTQLKELLSTVRLVTLTGIGGVGKTRLALRAATEVRHSFADGVWLTELGELRDGSLLVDVVAAGLGLRDDSGRPLLDRLIEFLRPRSVLLVLDNCEQMVDAVAGLTDTLLKACPQLHILATSRERLGIDGESEVRVLPLAVPDSEVEPELGGLASYESVALFSERAASAVAGFRVNDENQATVARICSRLDGLPLAIELAAARLRAMSLGQISDRLSDRFALLASGHRGVPTHQQTLRWSIAWSYDLCSADEQQVWSRLSVFVGSFELEAAERICAAESTPQDFLDTLTSLLDKSILHRTESKAGVRFRLLDSLREFGRERVEPAGGYVDLRRRHLDWYRTLTSQTEAGWFSPRQIEAIERVGREMPNVREALEFALSDSPESALEMASALYPFWISLGMLREARRWVERALGITPHEPRRERMNALYGAVMIGLLLDDTQAVADWLAEAADLAGDLTDPVARALFATTNTFVALIDGEFDRACACSDDAVGASDDPMVRVPALVLGGCAYEFGGDSDAALRRLETAIALAQTCGESVYHSYALWAVGVVRWRRGELDSATEVLNASLRLAHRVNDRRTGSTCLEALAWIAGAQGNWRRAVVLMAAAEALGLALGISTWVFAPLLVHHDECERRACEALDEDALEMARQEGSLLDFHQAVAYGLGT
jgi:predicted ATPase